MRGLTVLFTIELWVVLGLSIRAAVRDARRHARRGRIDRFNGDAAALTAIGDITRGPR